ncbi:MAG: Asp-tRNA(Asn)/Glu-tRNA(Gln) amidotransferase subunit GatB [Candidatus Paceibacterota bacterium]
MKYQPTIGIEVHAQLNTNTKMFCDSANDPDESRPNMNVCPVCMGHPGTLPVINKEAVRQVLRVGTAVGGEVADYTEFDRKNYYYPDLPKGYQISQYEYPLISGGDLAGVELTRIHLEEDTGTNIHKDGHSVVNYNRAGIPLMELVTEPVIHTAEDAKQFAKELQLLLRTLGASEANLEKGEMRIEANISVAPEGADELGTKVEVKNLNSFQVVYDAIEYEIKRQSEALDSDEELVQETRGWDENTGKTVSQRVKESSDDYRYFPDPDLPKLVLSDIPEFSEEKISDSLPELPDTIRARLAEKGVGDDDIDTLLQRSDLRELFDTTVDRTGDDDEKIRLAVNYITSDLIGLEREHNGQQEIMSENFAHLIEMIADDDLSSRGGKDTLAIMFADGGDPDEIAKKQGLLQKSSKEDLQPVVDEIITENKSVAEDYRSGDESVIQFMIGQGMKKTGGSANPQVLKQLLEETLKQ